MEGLGRSRLARRQRLTRILSRGLPPRAIPIIEELFAEGQRGCEECVIRFRLREISDGMRRPVSTGCDTLPMIDALEAHWKGDRL